jgi:hypothetical protein
MNDLEIFRAMTVACEMFAEFRVADLAALLGHVEASRFEQLMGQAFPLYKSSWPVLVGEEAATAVGVVAAMVESGDLAAEGKAQ